MTKLSPAAQAVIDAFTDAACGETYQLRPGIAAALRAANAQIPPLRYAADYVEHLLAIVTELEGQALPKPTTQPTTTEQPC